MELACRVGKVEKKLKICFKKDKLTILELFWESFQKDPTETRIELRKDLGLLGKFIFDSHFIFYFYFYFQQTNNNKIIIGSTSDIEYSDDIFILRTTAKSISELDSAIKSKLELEENIKIRLHFNRNGKLFVLDGMEDLKEGMTIKVSI